MNKVNIGDTVYFANGCENLTEGKVVHIFRYFGKEEYVIEYNAVIDAALEVRDWNTISLKPEDRLHLWERVAEFYKKYKEITK